MFSIVADHEPRFRLWRTNSAGNLSATSSPLYQMQRVHAVQHVQDSWKLH